MKIQKDKKLFSITLALSALVVIMIAAHGCKISSYGEKTLVSISITPASAMVAGGTVQQFNVTGTYSDSTTADISSSVTWSTSNSAATISAGGLATIPSVSADTTCTVTATAEGVTGTTTITIKNLPLLSITVTPGNPSISKNMTIQFAATGLFSNGTDTVNQVITTLVSWSSSTTTVATIDSSGLATGVAAGTSGITAQMGSVTSTAATLTVSNLAIQSITVTAVNTTVTIGHTDQMTATANFADGTTQDITSQVTWASSNTARATVDSSGLVTSLAIGSVTITASAGGQIGSKDLIMTNVAGH